MLIKSFVKLFSYAGRNCNHNCLLYFSTNSSLKTQNKIFPSIKFKPQRVYDSYYLNYLMKRMDRYSSVYDIENLFMKNSSDPEAIKLLLNLENNQVLPEEENFINELLRSTENNFNNYKVDEICKIIALVSNNNFFAQNRIYMQKITCCIDQELSKIRFSKNESLKILFTLTSVLNENYRASCYYFHYKAILKLLGKIDSLSIEEIVQTFYCIPFRDFSKTESKFFVLSYLSDIISAFNSDELGIIAEGLAKGNLTFSNEDIFCSILDKTRKEIEDIHPVPFISVCKVLQKFFRITSADSLRDFQEKLIPHVSKLDNQSLFNLVHTGYKFKVLDPTLRELAIKRWKECMTDLTYLEIVRLTYLTVAFNIEDKELLSLSVKNLEKVPSKHGSLISALNNLSFHRLYPNQFLDKVFSENFFNEVCNDNFRFKAKSEWWSLYCNVKLENPEYNIEAFNSSSLDAIYKQSKNLKSTQSKLKNERLHFSFRIIEKLLTEIYGENTVFLTDVLPHFHSGIVMRFNSKSQAQEIPEDFRSCEARSFKKPLKDDHFWIFVLLLNKFDFLWDTNTLDLIHQTQCRQLKALGYEILMVKLSTFLWVLKQKTEKAFIANLMEEFLRNISEKSK